MDPRQMEPPIALTDRDVSLRTARPVFLVGTAILGGVAAVALALGFTALVVACGVGFVVLFLVLALFVRQAGAPRVSVPGARDDSGESVRHASPDGDPPPADGDRYQEQWDRQLEIEGTMRRERDALGNRPRRRRPMHRIVRRIIFVSGAILAAVGVVGLVLGSLPLILFCLLFFALIVGLLRDIGRGRSRDGDGDSGDSDWLDGGDSGDDGGDSGGSDTGGGDWSDSTSSDSGSSDSGGGGGDSSSSNC